VASSFFLLLPRTICKCMEIFDKDIHAYTWLERITAIALIGGVLLCIYQPDSYTIKSWTKFSPLIAVGYWVIGLFFLAIKQNRLTMIAFISCGFLCIFLKNAANQDLVQPKRTNEPVVKIAQFNLAAVNGNYNELISKVIETDADVVSLQEVPISIQKWLEDTLKPIYPNPCRSEAADFRGILLFSKHAFISCDTIKSDNIPNLAISIRTKNSARKLFVICTYIAHPWGASDYKTVRHQLDTVANYANMLGEPFITVGDFNMEGSSYEIQQFRRAAGILDSRRGFQPMRQDGTYNFTEIPTDHIFYTQHFQCVGFQTISDSLKRHLGIVGTYQFQIESTQSNVSKKN
jgi:endonuclease/exonuclease/phosphatase (EEP) superfamily protein YafD